MGDAQFLTPVTGPLRHRVPSQVCRKGGHHGTADSEITTESLRRLMCSFVGVGYSAANPGPVGKEAMSNVLRLFSIDYDVSWIDNEGGKLNDLYPEKLVMVEADKSSPCSLCPSSSLNEPNRGSRWDADSLRSAVVSARPARARARFPVPTIFVTGGGDDDDGRRRRRRRRRRGAGTFCVCRSSAIRDADADSDSECRKMGEVRKLDARLLWCGFSVDVIFNFMLAERSAKPGVYLASTEVRDETKSYACFRLASVPYPDIEFFAGYPARRYKARGWKFDWTQPNVNVKVSVPWEQERFRSYECWDVVKLTRQYLELILDEVHGDKRDSSGVLLHCISGWDRTPLFCALSRILLWADGKVHRQLSPLQVAYLTVAYDWYLFGHQLRDRLSKGVEIMLFCYEFLRYYVEDMAAEQKLSEAKRSKLMDVRACFRDAYAGSVGLRCCWKLSVFTFSCLR